MLNFKSSERNENKIQKISFFSLYWQDFKRLVTDFPGGPVVKTPCFHCRGHGFDPWLGN